MMAQLHPMAPRCWLFLGSLLVVSIAGCDKPPPPSAPAAPRPVVPPPSPTATPPSVAPREPSITRAPLALNQDGSVQLPGPVLFETNTALLLPESEKVLLTVKSYLEQKPSVKKLRIEGHTDSEGGTEDNMKLSKARALAVTRWLIGHGIRCERLVPVGFGEQKPVVAEENDDRARQQNRRVQFFPAQVGDVEPATPVDGGEPGRIAGNPCQDDEG
ncbi:MAG: OmpA family protein [Myxococcota bacterium]